MENAEFQKVYFVVNPDDRYTLQKDHQAELNNDIGSYGGSFRNFITPYELNALKERGAIIIKDDVSVNEGDVLLSTGHGNYIILQNEETIKNILTDKVIAISDICHLLGASSFTAENYQEEIKNREISADYEADGNAKVKGHDVSVQGKLQGAYKNEETIKGKVNLTTTAVGIITQESYEAAKYLAIQYNLEGDRVIKSLLLKRNPKIPSGELREQEYEIELDYELKKELNLTYNVGVVLDKLLSVKCNAHFDAQSFQHIKEHFKFKVAFSPIIPQISKAVEDAQAEIIESATETKEIMGEQYKELAPQTNEYATKDDLYEIENKVLSTENKMLELHNEVQAYLQQLSQSFDYRIAELKQSFENTISTGQERLITLEKSLDNEKNQVAQKLEEVDVKIHTIQEDTAQLRIETTDDFNKLSNSVEDLRQEFDNKTVEITDRLTKEIQQLQGTVNDQSAKLVDVITTMQAQNSTINQELVQLREHNVTERKKYIISVSVAAVLYVVSIIIAVFL